jgi:porin-like protein
MIRKRTIGVMAALGGLAAAAALSAVSTAKADELADLRANQELLQQRIDQLAQGPGAIPSTGGGYLGGVPGAGAYPGPENAKTAGAAIVGGSFPRSFLVPGTDTSIRVGGTITVNYEYDMTGGNAHTTPASSSSLTQQNPLNAAQLHVHVLSIGPGGVVKTGNPNRSAGDQLSFISPQQSKVNFETRTPTAWGEARTFMEFDWANGNDSIPGNNALASTNNLVPRLRFAYATLGGLLGGQANSNFNDPDASTENITFGGMTGDPGVTRIPQVRYTWPLAPYGALGALSVSAEAPETDGWLPAGGVCGSDCTAAAVNPFKAPVPDLTVAWYIPQPWGHMDFSAVVRPELQMKDGQFLDRTFTGFGLHFGGDYKPGWFGWSKDHFTWQFEWGDGLGRYEAGNATEFSIVTNYPAARPLSRAAAGLVRARLTTSWGGNTGYQHWWSPTLRSNANFGILHHDINNLGGPDGFVCSGPARFSGAGGCGTNKELITTAVNLIWNPVPFADLGIEYVWDHRLVLSNLKGDVNGIITRFRVNF